VLLTSSRCRRQKSVLCNCETGPPLRPLGRTVPPSSTKLLADLCQVCRRACKDWPFRHRRHGRTSGSRAGRRADAGVGRPAGGRRSDHSAHLADPTPPGVRERSSRPDGVVGRRPNRTDGTLIRKRWAGLRYDQAAHRTSPVTPRRRKVLRAIGRCRQEGTGAPAQPPHAENKARASCHMTTGDHAPAWLACELDPTSCATARDCSPLFLCTHHPNPPTADCQIVLPGQQSVPGLPRTATGM
jgi:hypothetical protein